MKTNMQKTTTSLIGPATGQDHPRACTTDHDVELCRRLYEEYPVGHLNHLGYKRLARRFEVPVRTIRRWLRYTNR